MDEEITIIDSSTRNEKIKNFIINNKKKIIIIFSIIFITLIGYFSFNEIKERNKVKLGDQFNTITLNFETGSNKNITKKLINIIDKRNSTYSPLALYFLIDNDLIKDKDKTNQLFDILIEKTELETEIKNLIIYKKGLFNSDFVDENELIRLLNPIINSESIWKSHALYLVAEYFYSKNEKKKAKEFFNQILLTTNANKEVVLESEKRLKRDLRE
jgi:predicted negative regulator of RcsB-dependent stress response